MQIFINKKSMFLMLVSITAGMSASFTPRGQSSNNGVAGSSPNNDSIVETTPGHGHETDAEGVSPLRRTRNESTTIEFFEAPRTPRNDEELAAQTEDALLAEIAAQRKSFNSTMEARFQIGQSVFKTLIARHEEPTRSNVGLPAPKNTPEKPRQIIPGAEEFHNSIRSMLFEIDSQNLSFQQQEKSLNAARKKTLLALENKITNLHASETSKYEAIQAEQAEQFHWLKSMAGNDLLKLRAARKETLLALENKITNLHASETSRYEAIQAEQAKKFHWLKSMAGNDLWKLRTASRKKRLESPTLNDLMIDHNLLMDKVRTAHTKENQQYFQ